MPQNPPVIAGTRIGHVHLKVADLDRALGFYCGVLGFELMQRMGSGAAFISAGGYHHHIGLNTWESRGGSPPPPGTTGLYHVAVLYPTRRSLADALRRVLEAGIPLDGASEALYLRDPDAADEDVDAKVDCVHVVVFVMSWQWPIHSRLQGNACCVRVRTILLLSKLLYFSFFVLSFFSFFSFFFLFSFFFYYLRYNYHV